LARQYFDYRAGLGNVGSYQSSAKPFLSSSIHVSASNDIVKIDFINVTRFITIKNTGPDQTNEVEIRVGFSENGVNGVEDNNYFTLNNQESFSADWRVNAVYLRVNPTGATTNATASVIAGLTTIASQELFHNWTGSQGVG
jgi:hypothetical protein|tara:strand:+ start:451 stop:873 length:423 start_codon:yes stop_codon:yes gene_type:complete